MSRALHTGTTVALTLGLWASSWQRAQTAGENVFAQGCFSPRTRIHCKTQHIAHTTSRNIGNTSQFGSCLSPTLFGHALETTMKRIFLFTPPASDVLKLRSLTTTVPGLGLKVLEFRIECLGFRASCGGLRLQYIIGFVVISNVYLLGCCGLS